jgi:hypothetical protein
MATVDVAPYFRLFIFIEILNIDGSKRVKFPITWGDYHNFPSTSLCEVDECKKMPLFPFDNIDHQKFIINIIKYLQQCLHSFTNKEKSLHYTFETRLWIWKTN